MIQFALKITNVWTQKDYLYPTLFDRYDDAEKAIHKIPQSQTQNNKIEIVEIHA